MKRAGFILLLILLFGCTGCKESTAAPNPALPEMRIDLENGKTVYNGLEQRFYQVDSARSGGEGTGLGLYMVRQIARLHGGTAEVDSAPGQGSTFTVRIPAHRK